LIRAGRKAEEIDRFWLPALAEVSMGRHVLILMLVPLTLIACRQPNPSGLTKEQAEAVLLERGYTDPTLGPTQDGWSGYAVVHGYKMNLTVGKHGIVTMQP
jgi:hypothetical protein